MTKVERRFAKNYYEKGDMKYDPKNLNIKFEREYKFEDCRNKNLLPFDFYLLDYNSCIEFDGSQHFKLNEFFGGAEGFKKIVKNDQIKNEYCKNNNIRLIRIRYDHDIYSSIISELISWSFLVTVINLS